MRLFRPGQLSIDNVSAPGYAACPAYNWLRANGSREARFEAQTVIVENADAVYEAIRNVQGGWARNEFGMVFPQAAPRTQGEAVQAAPNTDPWQAAPNSPVPVSQTSTQADDSQMALG